MDLDCHAFREDQFARFVLPCSTRALSIARRWLPCYEDAMDACQEALLKAWLAFSQVNNTDCIEAWFFAIVRRTCLDMLRKKQCSLSLDEDILDEESFEWRFIPIYEMDEGLLELLFFRYSCGYSKYELMRYYHISEATYKSRMAKARKQLKNLFSD